MDSPKRKSNKRRKLDVADQLNSFLSEIKSQDNENFEKFRELELEMDNRAEARMDRFLNEFRTISQSMAPVTRYFQQPVLSYIPPPTPSSSNSNYFPETFSYNQPIPVLGQSSTNTFYGPSTSTAFSSFSNEQNTFKDLFTKSEKYQKIQKQNESETIADDNYNSDEYDVEEYNSEDYIVEELEDE